MYLVIEYKGCHEVAKTNELPDHQLIDKALSINEIEKVDVDPCKKEYYQEYPVKKPVWDTVVFKEEHDDNVGPEECHQERGLTGTSEAKGALPIRRDIEPFPKRPTAFESELGEGEEINSHACNKCSLVGEPTVTNEVQDEQDENDGIILEQEVRHKHEPATNCVSTLTAAKEILLKFPD